MQTNEGQLHPNWRALATLHLPLKRFVREGVTAHQPNNASSVARNCEIQSLSGEEIKEFYNKIVEGESTRPTEGSNQYKTQTKEATAAKSPSKVPFDKHMYFRLAMENRAEELANFDYKNNDMNVRDAYGWTALMMAACEGALQAVEVLLALGIDKSAKEKTGKTALELAHIKGHKDIVKLLEREVRPSSPKPSKEEEVAPKPFYCTTCKRKFVETTLRDHYTSTVHQFNMKSSMPSNKLQKFNIPQRNRGLQLMVKQGWDVESGLGPTRSGRLYPVKTVIRKQRSGIGIEQEPARVTHFGAFDERAIQRRSRENRREKRRSRNDIRHERQRERKRDRRLRNELS